MTGPELWLLDAALPDGRRKMEPAESGKINAGFQERREAHFEASSSGGRSLLIDDAPAIVLPQSGENIWQWQPGFYAGTVEARLITSGEKTETRYLFDVSPDPAKVGQDIFQRMVDEAWAFDPDMMLGTEPATRKLGEFGDRQSLHVRYSRIAKYAQPLGIAIEAVLRDPHRVLRSIRVRVAASRVRVVDRVTANAALSSSAAALFFDLDEAEMGAIADTEPLFDVPLSEPSFDTAANRSLGALLSSLLMCIQGTRGQFEELIASEQEEGTRTGLKERWPRRKALLDELEITVRRGLRKEPFRSLPRREVSAAGLTAIASHPVYSRTQSLLWRMIRPGYEHGDSSERAWMSPTWGIYESWCFVAMVNGFRAALPSFKWRRLRENGRDYIHVGSDGDLTVQIRYQQCFQYSPTPPQSGFWSVSKMLIPDIVLVVESGKSSAWMVVDAKYRQHRSNVLDAMRSAHIYRDALRRFDAPPGRSVLLVPAQVDDAAWLHGLEFQESHGVGAIVMSPESNAVNAILERLLDLVGVSLKDKAESRLAT